MRWLAATVTLLTASVALAGGVYLRDRDPGAWRPPEATLARSYARTLLAALGGTGCTHGVCGVMSLTRTSPSRWLAAIEVHSRTRCFEIDLDRFAVTETHGVEGIAAVSCA
jgi:hypothetical protein